MKHLAVLAIFIMVSLGIYSQNIKTKRKISKLEENLFLLVEKTKKDTIVKGYLSSKEPEIKQGEFEFFNSDGILEIKGEYTNNSPSGIWYYYNDLGIVEDSLNYQKTKDFLSNREMNNEENVFYVVEEMPTFKGQSFQAFSAYLAKNLYYPPYALMKGIEGKVFVSLVVNKEGEVRNVKIFKSSGNPDLDMEALRVIIESDGWEPGKQRGKKMAVALTFPVSFILY